MRLARRELLAIMGTWPAAQLHATPASAHLASIAYLHDGSGADRLDRSMREAFAAGLVAHGFGQGDATLTFHYSDGFWERLADAVSARVLDGVDVFVANGDVALFAALSTTTTVPIITSYASAGAVEAVAEVLGRRAANVAGPLLEDPGIWAERARLVAEAVGGARHLAVIGGQCLDWGLGQGAARLERVRREIAGAGFAVTTLPITNTNRIAAVFRQARGMGVEAAVIVDDTACVGIARSLIAWHAARIGLPTIGAHAAYAEDGLLLSYGPDVLALQRQAASFVAQILAGRAVDELAPTGPGRLALAVNLRTAFGLELDLPQRLLERAGQRFGMHRS